MNWLIGWNETELQLVSAMWRLSDWLEETVGGLQLFVDLCALLPLDARRSCVYDIKTFRKNKNYLQISFFKTTYIYFCISLNALVNVSFL